MSSRPQIRKYPVITDGDMAATSVTSAVTIISDLTKIGYAYSWSGSTPIGTIIVQVSNDYARTADGQGVANAGTWTTLSFTLSGATVASAPVSGNTGTGFIDLGTTAAFAIRTVYTKTSGTGTIQAVINAKVS